MKKSILGLIILAGCQVGPKYCPPVVENLPCEWHNQLPEHMVAKTEENLAWWKEFNDPTLNWLLDQALDQSLDLCIAATRLEQARRLKVASGSQRLPRIDATAGFCHAYFNQETLDKILGNNKGDRHGKTRNVDLFEFGFDALWEIDLFGKSKHDFCAQVADYHSAQEAFNTVWISLSAEIARVYIELRGYQLKEELLLKNIKSTKNSYELITDLYDAGITGKVDLKKAEEKLYLLEVELPAIHLAVSQLVHRLSVLLGHPPAHLDAYLKENVTLPTPPSEIPLGLPSELLRRRADIRQAEYQVQAATERVGSAVAEMFPRLSLKGFIGNINTHLPSLLSGTSNTWIAGPQLLLPIFNSRQIEQDIKLNKLKVREALFEYQKTVLVAFEEVENSIAAMQSASLRDQITQKRLDASRETYELMLDLHESGLKDSFELLTLQREFINSEEAYIQRKCDLLIQIIALYKALGGGWSKSYKLTNKMMIGVPKKIVLL